MVAHGGKRDGHSGSTVALRHEWVGRLARRVAFVVKEAGEEAVCK